MRTVFFSKIRSTPASGSSECTRRNQSCRCEWDLGIVLSGCAAARISFGFGSARMLTTTGWSSDSRARG